MSLETEQEVLCIIQSFHLRPRGSLPARASLLSLHTRWALQREEERERGGEREREEEREEEREMLHSRNHYKMSSNKAQVYNFMLESTTLSLLPHSHLPVVLVLLFQKKSVVKKRDREGGR